MTANAMIAHVAAVLSHETVSRLAPRRSRMLPALGGTARSNRCLI